MKKNKYSGTVSGVKALSNGKYLLFVETDRHIVNEGVGFDVVYSNEYVSLLSTISYKIVKTKRGFICVA